MAAFWQNLPNFITGSSSGTSGQFAYFTGSSSIASTSAITLASGVVTVNTGAHTTLTASVECPSVVIDCSATKQWATGAIASQYEFKILAPTYGFVAASTVAISATVYISGAPIAGTNATLTEKHALHVASGSSEFSGRILASKGADVASANDCTLGTDGNVFALTGTTTINGIAVSGWNAGSEVTLLFGTAITMKHDTAASGGFASMKLSGAADFSATDGDVLKLVYTGTYWVETSRTVI